MPQERKFFYTLSKRQKIRHLKNIDVDVSSSFSRIEGPIGSHHGSENAKNGTYQVNNKECPIPDLDEGPSDQETDFPLINHNIINDEHDTRDMSLIAHEVATNDSLPAASRLPQITNNLSTDLRSWVIENSVAHSLVNSLLAILHKHLNDEHSLPIDVRTLLGTPRTVHGIVDVSPGFYKHFGIAESSSRNISKYYTVHNVPHEILLNINIDGLPLAKSSGSQFWPILGSISTNFYTVPFIIGCYHGYHKPDNPNEFLQCFVAEMKLIEEHGMHFLTKNLQVKLNAVICDSPARAYVCCVKGHNAYFGCGKCTTEGDYVDGRVTYPQTDAILRTNRSFNDKLQIEHHKEALTSNLTMLNIDMITNIPLDYMHLCCLGVMKRILQLWCRGPKNIKMHKNEFEKFSTTFVNLKPFIPKEFARKPRAIEEMDRFKATEYRQILLYTGIVVLKDTLRTDQYPHFLCFSLAIRILLSQEYHQKFNNYAQNLLQYFVKNFSVLYGAHNVSYNVHNLIHLSYDAKFLGPLDSFSAFKFENYMQTILKKIKVSWEPLKQLCNRVSEEYKNPQSQPQNKTEVNFPVLVYKKNQNDLLSHLQYNNFILSTRVPDNTCLLKDGNSRFISLVNFYKKDNNILIKAHVHQDLESFFHVPSDSKKFYIFVIYNEVNVNESISMTISELISNCHYIYRSRENRYL